MSITDLKILKRFDDKVILQKELEVGFRRKRIENESTTSILSILACLTQIQLYSVFYSKGDSIVFCIL